MGTAEAGRDAATGQGSKVLGVGVALQEDRAQGIARGRPHKCYVRAEWQQGVMWYP